VSLILDCKPGDSLTPCSYYEIRETDGFKNVSLANILAAKAPNEEITFIHPDDLALYNKWFVHLASMMDIVKLNCAPGTAVLSNFK
jgi:hypothetical protein